MEFIKGTPYFCMAKNKIKQYKYLSTDHTTDILIIGGGICGAILNNFLSQKYNTTLIEQQRLALANTSCATALLEYQLDDLSSQLKNQLSESEIVQIYQSGLCSIDKIEEICKTTPDCHFAKRPTLMFSKNKKDIKKFVDEYNFRKSNGFECELITKQNTKFNFDIEIGIYAENGGCEFNPYLFTKNQIETSKNQNQIFENTKYICHKQSTNSNFLWEVETSFGNTIFCNKIIFSTGYNFEHFKDKDLFTRYTTYSIVTNKIENFEIFNNTLIHDFEKPYHYLRILPDNRIIFGGEDSKLTNPKSKANKAKNKYKKLLNDLTKMFPELKNKIFAEYEFLGGFGETDNNLGLIGETKEKGVYLFLSCGANGIINAINQTQLIDDLICEKENAFEHLFSPERIINS